MQTGRGFDDANWTALGSGMNDQVYALAVSGSNVYAGGKFTMAGGVSVGCVARWDGKSWSALGSGLNGYVYSLAVSGTNLYVGGSFSTAGGSSAHNVAKWNGTAWSALGSGIGESPFYSGQVMALAVAGTNLYVGGSFGHAGFATAYNIARWDGITWSALSAGTSGNAPSPTVYALATSGSNVYVGGDFITAGGFPANHIARWDGSLWHNLGEGMSGANSCSVYSLAVAGTNLYAVGLFPNAGASTNANTDVARWNGSSWSPLGLGVYAGTNYYPSVHAAAVYGNDLIIGGDFTKAGGSGTNRNAASRIARWNGVAWSGLGSGMNTNVQALAISGNDLYVGGKFTTAGGKSAAYVARADLRELPALALTPSEAGLTLSWPVKDTADFVLETASNLAVGTYWSLSSDGVMDDGTNKFVSLPATNGTQFFRLRRP